MNWYLAVLKKYATFTGRARRKEFWMFVLINSIISWGLLFIDIAIGSAKIDFNTGTVEYGFFSTIYALLVLLPSIAVSVRRLHDTGRSGWWLLLGVVFTTILGVIGFFIAVFIGMFIGIFIGCLIGTVILLILYSLDSQAGENKYGVNPKEINQE
ncbi:DUF805 domain-containing protein [Ursidibacter arcticus]